MLLGNSAYWCVSPWSELALDSLRSIGVIRNLSQEHGLCCRGSCGFEEERMLLYVQRRLFVCYQGMYNSEPDNVPLNTAEVNISVPCLFTELIEFIVSRMFMAVPGILQADILMCFHIPKILKTGCLLHT